MARPPSWSISVDRYIRGRGEGLTRETAISTRSTLLSLLAELSRVGMTTDPKRIGEAEIHHLLRSMPWSSGTLRRAMSQLGTYCEVMGSKNPVRAMARRRTLRIPRGERIEVRGRWLGVRRDRIETDAMVSEMVEVWEAAKTSNPITRWVVHGGLFLCTRTRDLCSLVLSDVGEGSLVVRGKGGAQGKDRTLPFREDPPTSVEVDRILDHRRDLITSTIRRWPRGNIPDAVALVRNGASLRPLSPKRAQDHVRNLSRRIGIPMSSHTLRRTGARFLHVVAGVPVREIMRILGHETEAQTEAYIGIRWDAAADAQAMADEAWTARSRRDATLDGLPWGFSTESP